MAMEATFLDTQNEWLNLGFKYAPFNADSKSNHYRSQSFVSCLNKMLTLDTTNACVAVLNGEAGSGKTTCLKAFTKTHSSYHNVYVPASSGLSPVNLQKVIQLNTGVKVAIQRSPSKEQTVKLVRALSQLKYKIRIIIDDAEKLPHSTINLIDMINQTQPTGDMLQILLASTHPVQSHFPSTICVFNLSNLSKKETHKYIMLRLTRAFGNTAGVNIPNEVLDKVYHLSQGNIVKINNLASIHVCNHLITSEGNDNDMNRHDEHQHLQRQQTLMYLIIPLAILQVVSIYYALSPSKGTWIPHKKTTSLHKKALSRVQKPKPTTPHHDEIAAVSIDPAIIEELHAGSGAMVISTTNALANNLPSLPSSTKAQQEAFTHNARVMAAINALPAKKAIPAEQEPTAKVVSEKSAASTPPVTKVAQVASKTFPKKGWMLQLAALDSDEQVASLKAKVDSHLTSKFWTYKAPRGDVEKNIVLIGPFSSKAEVKKATANSKLLKSANPWLRNASAVAKEAHK